MDWGRNNKEDREEEAYFYHVILQEEEEEQRHPSSAPDSEFRISPFGGAVGAIVLLLCIFALFMGYAHILGIGFIVFLILNSLF